MLKQMSQSGSCQCVPTVDRRLILREFNQRSPGKRQVGWEVHEL